MPIYEELMGNPFVDAGVCGICEWLGRNIQPEQITTADLETIVGDVVPIMRPFDKKKPEAHGWQNWISIFTNNHKLTNPSIKSDQRVPQFKDLLFKYIDEVEELSQTGDCIGCGRRDANIWLSRTGVPLTGWGNCNYFPIFSEGAGYCSACAFAIQMSPLVFMATGGKFLTLHSNSWKALRSWARVCVEDVREQHLKQEVTGCYTPGYANPRNGMFYMAREMLKYRELRPDENISIQVFCWTNYIQGPELEVFYMPAPVFKFLRIVHQSEFKTAWQEIVRSAYLVNWDKVTSEDDYKNRTNRVYENLLQDRSILGFFLNKRLRKPRGNWELLSLYLKEVRTMEQAQLDKIKQVGDLIAKGIKKSGRDRRLRQLESAKSYGECRNILRYVIRDRIQQGAPEPLFSIDDYMEYLFPASDNLNLTPWRETRDLLLFRIYEQLHNWLQEQGYVDYDEDNTTDPDDTSQEED